MIDPELQSQNEEINQIYEQAERELALFLGPDGTVAFDLSAHIISGSRE